MVRATRDMGLRGSFFLDVGRPGAFAQTLDSAVSNSSCPQFYGYSNSDWRCHRLVDIAIKIVSIHDAICGSFSRKDRVSGNGIGPLSNGLSMA
jgi:hypothetical protein